MGYCIMIILKVKIDNNSDIIAVGKKENHWVAVNFHNEELCRGKTAEEVFKELEEIYNTKLGEGIVVEYGETPPYNEEQSDTITLTPSTFSTILNRKATNQTWDNLIGVLLDKANSRKEKIREDEIIDKVSTDDMISTLKVILSKKPSDERYKHLGKGDIDFETVKRDTNDILEAVLRFWDQSRPDDADKLRKAFSLTKEAAVVRPIDNSLYLLRRYASGEETGVPVTRFKWQYVNLKHQICHKCLRMHNKMLEATDLLGPRLDGISGRFKDVKNTKYGASPMYYLTHPNCVCQIVPIMEKNARFMDKLPANATGFSFTQLPRKGSLKFNNPQDVFVREVVTAPKRPGEYYVNYDQGYCITNVPVKMGQSIEYEYEAGQSIYGKAPITAYSRTVTGSLNKIKDYSYIDLQQYIYNTLPYKHRDNFETMYSIADKVLKEANINNFEDCKRLVNKEILNTFMKVAYKEAKLMRKIAGTNELLVEFKKGITDMTERLFNLIRKKSSSGVFSKLLESNDRINTMLNYIQALQREALFLPVSDDGEANVATAKTLKKRIVRTANMLEDLGFEDEVNVVDRFLAEETNRHIKAASGPVKRDFALLLREAQLNNNGISGKNPELGNIELELPQHLYFHDVNGETCYIATAEVSDEHFQKIAELFPSGKSIKIWGNYPYKVWISGYGWGPTGNLDVKSELQNGYIVKKAFAKELWDKNSETFNVELDYSDPMKIFKNKGKEKELKSIYDKDRGKSEKESKKSTRALSMNRQVKTADYGPTTELFRHCPDHPGVMVMPVAGRPGVVQCPVNGMIYVSQSGVENQTPSMGWNMTSFDYSDLAEDKDE